jgi:hypothetical protein
MLIVKVVDQLMKNVILLRFTPNFEGFIVSIYAAPIYDSLYVPANLISDLLVMCNMYL